MARKKRKATGRRKVKNVIKNRVKNTARKAKSKIRRKKPPRGGPYLNYRGED
ncbi:MAG: hypothetical protein KAJ19_08385 [Gammaproteobacteria bacterium]|nr:hypothetical protein [Gammaproteobacteria bacterium]